MAGDELDAVHSAVAALPAEVTSCSDAELVDQMRRLTAAVATVEAALAARIGAFDARRGAGYDGQTSTRAWLRSRLRMGPVGSDLLLIARHLPALPQAWAAFAAGQIGREHAVVLARLVGQVGAAPVGPFEPIVVELARQAAPGQLVKACAHLRQLIDGTADEPETLRQQQARHLSVARTLYGMVHLQGLLDPTAGEVVLTALRAATPVPGVEDDRTAGQRRADSLTDICAGWLRTGQAPTSGGVPPQVQVTISLDALRSAGTDLPAGDLPAGDLPAGDLPAGDLPAGDLPILASGHPIPAARARQIACDAGIIPVVLGTGSEILDIGRQSRLIPAGIRRALHLRDGGCRFPGCDRPASWCDAHHLIPWTDGGHTSLRNLILVCRHHHSLIHQGWRLAGDPHGGLGVHRPDGSVLPLTSHPRHRPPGPRPNPRPTARPRTRRPGKQTPTRGP